MACSRRSVTRPCLLLLCAMIAVVGFLAFAKVRSCVRAAGTMKRLYLIALALNNYHDIHGCFPPQYLTDGHGNPAHSWRVLLLPYMGYEDIYARYSFGEPWNGPHNRFLEPEMPEEYRSPFAGSGSTTTQYVGIAGEHTLWWQTTSLRWTDVRNMAEDQIWIVEAANSDINWMEPRDIPAETAGAGIHSSRGGGIRSNYGDELPVVMLLTKGGWTTTWVPLK